MYCIDSQNLAYIVIIWRLKKMDCCCGIVSEDLGWDLGIDILRECLNCF